MLRRLLRIGLMTLAVALPLATGRAQELKVGDPAPAIVVSEFLRGETITAFERNRIYAVVFWSSWSAAARATMPQIAELQRRFPKVCVVAVSIWEREPERPKTFLEQNASKFPFTIATDSVADDATTGDGVMSKTWMDAAAQSHPLTTFLVDSQGKVAWVGALDSVDAPLRQVLAGTWDIKAARLAFLDTIHRAERIDRLKQDYLTAWKAHDTSKALALLDAAITSDATLEPVLGLLKYQALHETNEAAADTFGLHLVEEVIAHDAGTLNQFAWSLVDPMNGRKPTKAEVALALLAARRADELCKGEDAAICDTLAKAYYDNRDFKMARTTQERSILLARGTAAATDKNRLARLELYRKAAKP